MRCFRRKLSFLKTNNEKNTKTTSVITSCKTLSSTRLKGAPFPAYPKLFAGT